MPATVESTPESTPATLESTPAVSPSNSGDSTFTYYQSSSTANSPVPATLDMDRLRETVLSRSSEHIRTDSVDSGYGGPVTLRVSETSSLAVKRTTSNSAKQHRSSFSEQTHLLVEKMFILEKKLNSMDSQLKNEQVQRLNLEAKVVKLERDNEQLKSSRSQAGLQLQNFAEIFYAETETIKINGSLSNPSTRNTSLAELRSRSRTSSLSSNNSRGSRFSHVSL